jgi:cyclic-di-AMP phosphodiesterase
MKIILNETIKGKGKAGQTIDVPAGYANFLVREQKAVIATDIALEAKAAADAQAQAKEAALVDAMQALAKRLDALSIVIAMKVGSEGKTFGAISSKQIAQAFADQHNIELDKKKIEMRHPINMLGRFDVTIQLHKTIDATLHVSVVEE